MPVDGAPLPCPLRLQGVFPSTALPCSALTHSGCPSGLHLPTEAWGKASPPSPHRSERVRQTSPKGKVRRHPHPNPSDRSQGLSHQTAPTPTERRGGALEKSQAGNLIK